MSAPTVLADPTPRTYGQVLIHTADGGTYVVTGDLGEFVYKALPGGNFTGCMIVNGAVGLPPATNDLIFKDNFETTIDICYPE